MELRWLFTANLIYYFGSIGYLFLNLSQMIDRNNKDLEMVYRFSSFLSIVFIIDALFYLIDWLQERRKRTPLELFNCLLNLIGSFFYLLGDYTLAKSNFSHISSSTIFYLLSMSAFVLESTLCFFIPNLYETTAKYSTEFFAHSLNLIGNLVYLISHTIHPVVWFVDSFMSRTTTIDSSTDLIVLIVHQTRLVADLIYTIDAALYMIVWLKANQQIQKVGNSWIDRTRQIISNENKSMNLETVVRNCRERRQTIRLELDILETINEDVEPSTN